MTEQNFTTEELNSEIWKPIERFNGLYEISNLGRIKRLANAFRLRPTEKLLKSYLNEAGYERIGLRVEGGKQTSKYVHQLVAEVFICPCPKNFEVNHIDCVKGNNRAGNLEYLSRQNNVKHAMDNGLYKSGKNHHYTLRPETIRKGEKHPCSKLTEKDVIEIREHLQNGVPQKQLAKTYKVTKSSIYSIKYRKSWSHI